MGRAAGELDGLRQAVDEALRSVLPGRCVPAVYPGLQLVVLGPADLPRGSGLRGLGERHGRMEAGRSDGVDQSRQHHQPQEHHYHPGLREHEVAGELSLADFGLDVRIPALRGRSGRDVSAAAPTSLLIARYVAGRYLAGLSSADSSEDVQRIWATARWFTAPEHIDGVSAEGRDGVPATDEESVLEWAARLSAHPEPVVLVLMADGAACHGPKAPRAQDPRAAAYDERVAAALAVGSPGDLAAVPPDLGRRLGASGAALWPVLAAAAASPATPAAGAVATPAVAAWEGRVLWQGAPYGVGWTVATWRRGVEVAIHRRGVEQPHGCGSPQRSEEPPPVSPESGSSPPASSSSP